MKLHCCGCNHEVEPRLTDGSEIYKHRPDLYSLPFWKCDACGNFVGCHHKTKERTKPLGSIPTKQIRELRKIIHSVLDPLWKEKRMKRSAIYAELTELIGRQYHTAEVNSEDEANIVLRHLDALAKEKP